MLVLSRKKDERIVIEIPPSDEKRVITLQPLDFRGNRVRLGVQADKDVSIHREEVYNAIKERQLWDSP